MFNQLVHDRWLLLLLSTLTSLMKPTSGASDVPVCEGTFDAECAKRQKIDPGGTDKLSQNITTRAGLQMPRLLYGTAWKKERTEDLVIRAVKSGFRGIDTACQPKHYNEGGTGTALASLIGDVVTRDELFIQTKVNRNYAQEMLPDASIKEQVRHSILKSLSNLGVAHIDSLVLHSPYKLHNDTMEAWRAMEESVQSGQVKQLGISNVRSLKDLKRLFDEAVIKPAVVQQRFYAKTGFERDMRSWCLKNDVRFQSFWTLTANSKSKRLGQNLLTRVPMLEMATKYDVSVQVLFFRFLMGLGIVPLTGTCSDQHMADDLLARSVTLSSEDAEKITKWMHEQIEEVSSESS